MPYYFLSISLSDILLSLTLSLVKKDICETSQNGSQKFELFLVNP